MRRSHENRLPSTTALLASGGDSRIVLDPATGTNRYGSLPAPDASLIALGSCTASPVSQVAWQAANALRTKLQSAFTSATEESLYAHHLQLLRHELLSLLGCAENGTAAIFAASGTDLFVLAGQWLRPQITVMIDPAETGSGMPSALCGLHFDTCSASGAATSPGAAITHWRGEMHPLAVRDAEGNPRNQVDIDTECAALVVAAASTGVEVLLVLTDVSKTGLIAPGIGCALTLQRRWPAQVKVLVDACQFRLSPMTIRAYLSQGCMVALTGSKFIGGPSFSGALLVPDSKVARLREQPLTAECASYSNAAEWPPGWVAASQLPSRSNFGLLLRWEAALVELRRFLKIPAAEIQHATAAFSEAVRSRLNGDPRFAALPVPALDRSALQLISCWDNEQTIFPVIVLKDANLETLRPVSCEQARQLYMNIRRPAGHAEQGYVIGQPVTCGVREGVPVAALRLCVGAPLLSTVAIGTLIAQAYAVLDRLAVMAEHM